MSNEMMGDHEENYIIHWWKFECDEFDFYSGYKYQVNCPNCLKRLSEPPFTDTSAIEPEADSARFHGQEAAV